MRSACEARMGSARRKSVRPMGSSTSVRLLRGARSVTGAERSPRRRVGNGRHNASEAGVAAGPAGFLSWSALDALLQEAIQPAQHFLVPENRVARLEHPVVLVGEVDETRRNTLPLEHVVAGDALGHRYPVVPLAMDHEHGRYHAVAEPPRIPL